MRTSWIGRMLKIRWWLGSAVVLSLILLSPSATLAGDTLAESSVPNSDFELVPITGNLPPSWNYDSAGLQTGLSLSFTERFSGRNSMRLVKSTPQTQTTSLPLVVESAKLEITRGEVYEATVKLKIESISGNSELRIRWYDQNQQPLNKQAIYTIPTSSILNKWLDIKVKGTAPFNAYYATILVYTPGTSAMTAYVDDSQFFKIGDYTDLINGGFEEYTGTNIEVWSLYKNTLPPGTSYAPYTADKPAGGGTASLKLVDNSTASNGEIGLLSNVVKVSTGSIYEVTAKVKRISGTQTVYLKFYSDLEGTTEIGGIFSYGISYAPNWTSFTFQGTAPTGAKSARVLLLSHAAGTSEVLYDDVSLFIKGLDVKHTHGSPINLGDAALSLTIQGGAISRANNEVYFVLNGDPGRFYAVNASTGAVNFSQEVPGTTQTWAVVVEPNSNKVYFSSTNDGKLWRYDPNSMPKKIDWVGTNPAPNSTFTWDLDADANGKLIGSTYSEPNDGRIYEFNTNASTNPFSDFNNKDIMFSGQDYVRGAAVTNSYVYAGIGATKHLMRMDRATEVTQEIPLPSNSQNEPIQGQPGFVHNIWVYNGKLFVLHGTSLIIMNENPPGTNYTTALQIGPINSKISPPSPYNSNLIYYHNKIDNKIWSYNTATNATAVVSSDRLPNTEMRAAEWINVGGTYKLAMLFSDTDYRLFDPSVSPGPITTLDLNISEGPITIQSLALGPDNKLYLGGFIDSLSVFDIISQAYQLQKYIPESPNQIEETGFLNGKTYFGAYSGARIYRYDPSQPYSYGETATNNPGLIKSIQGQDRPYAFASGDNKLFIGTIPKYGAVGGALITFTETPGTSGSWSQPHTDFVSGSNQSISALAYRSNLLYGGTTISGGLNSTPTATSAKLFKWNTALDQLSLEKELEIDDFTPTLIGHLTFDAAGNLWGAAHGKRDNGIETFAIFEMNPVDFSVISYKLVYDQSPGGSKWRGFYLYFGSDGLLYTTIGRYLTVFKPSDLSQYTKVVDKNVQLMALAPNGDIYYTTGGRKLFKLPMNP